MQFLDCVYRLLGQKLSVKCGKRDKAVYGRLSKYPIAAIIKMQVSRYDTDVADGGGY